MGEVIQHGKINGLDKGMMPLRSSSGSSVSQPSSDMFSDSPRSSDIFSDPPPPSEMVSDLPSPSDMEETVVEVDRAREVNSRARYCRQKFIVNGSEDSQLQD